MQYDLILQIGIRSDFYGFGVAADDGPYQTLLRSPKLTSPTTTHCQRSSSRIRFEVGVSADQRDSSSRLSSNV